ncbi:glycine betaine ABC transporter substrate-binding protein [Glycomyces artemisiae]|uniref:Glycine betaine/proline transport system substrate-binding protein n=2 Tax=Glycomyces artemisiae TaxID=1076443 RepID=A0A2T0UI95_9ACTN|nr:glycine betaine ABC transporter substrate-binding protein [Glycomyces artemisiae]PRY57655.1 glycine betaine/proline transport system substrate-binding protein [Glycomyces artemisiae]
MQRRSIMKGAVATGGAIALAACSVEEEPGDAAAEGVDFGLPEGEGEIVIGYINWDEAVVATELWRQALESAGYTVTTQEFTEVGPLFEGLSSGDLDVFLDGWLPITHQTYMDTYGDQLEQLGTWNENAALTVAVPTYVDVDSLEDLNANADLFGGRIVGIEASAGLTEAVQNSAIPTYGITDLTLETSSTTAMLTELDSAIAAEEPIVVTLWQPHWAYAKYDLKNLADPQTTLGEAETINVLARTGFSEEFADVAGALETFAMSDEQLADLENLVFAENGGDVQAGVTAWLQDNEFKDLIA